MPQLLSKLATPEYFLYSAPVYFSNFKVTQERSGTPLYKISEFQPSFLHINIYRKPENLMYSINT